MPRNFFLENNQHSTLTDKALCHDFNVFLWKFKFFNFNSKSKWRYKKASAYCYEIFQAELVHAYA